MQQLATAPALANGWPTTRSIVVLVSLRNQVVESSSAFGSAASNELLVVWVGNRQSDAEMAMSAAIHRPHPPKKPPPARLRPTPPTVAAQERELDDAAAKRKYKTDFDDFRRELDEQLAAEARRRNRILPGLAQLVSAHSVAHVFASAATGDEWMARAADAIGVGYDLDRRDADFKYGDGRDDIVSPDDRRRQAMSPEERQRREIEAGEHLDLAIVIPLVKGQTGAKPAKWVQSDPRAALVIANASRVERGETPITEDDPDRITAAGVDQITAELRQLHEDRWRGSGQSLAGQLLKAADQVLLGVGARGAAEIVGDHTYRTLVRRGAPDRQPTRAAPKRTRAQIEKAEETLRERARKTEEAYEIVERLYVETAAFVSAHPSARAFFLTELKARARPLERAHFLVAPPKTRDELMAAARALEEEPA